MAPRLEEWFNLETYSPVSNFHSIDWLEQLEVRQRLFQAYDDAACNRPRLHLTTKEKLEIVEPYKQFEDKHLTEKQLSKTWPAIEEGLYKDFESSLLIFQTALKAVRKNPVGHSVENFPEDFYSFYPPLRAFSLGNRPHTGLYNFNFQTWGELGTSIPTKAQKILLKNGGFVFAKDLKELKSILTPDSYSELWGNEKLYLVVDLNTPDKLLINEFKKYLKHYRNLAKTGEIPNSELLTPGLHKTQRPPFNTWCENELLPFIDLYLWELENKLTNDSFKFYDKQYLDALYPDNEEKETYSISRLRAIADECTSGPYLDYLSGIVTQDNMI